MKTFLVSTLLASLLILTGCKSTHAEHTWPDGSRTVVDDTRFFHKQEASFAFRRDTNGAVTVQARVASGVDVEALKKVYEAGVAVGEKAALGL